MQFAWLKQNDSIFRYIRITVYEFGQGGSHLSVDASSAPVNKQPFTSMFV